MAITDWKDATGQNLPAALPYFRLTGQVAIPTADSPDPGLNPDVIEPIGSVILSPKLNETRFPGTKDADPLTIALVDIPIKINHAGQLYVIDAEAGARILNTADPRLNPSCIPYTVRFEFEEVDDIVKPRIVPFDILPPPPREDGEPWVLDITQLAEIAAKGEIVSVEMARALVAAAWSLAKDSTNAAEFAEAKVIESADNAAEARAAAEVSQAKAVESANSAAQSKQQAETATAAVKHSESLVEASAASAAEAKAQAGESAKTSAAAQAAAEAAQAKAVESANSAAQSKQQAETATAAVKHSESLVEASAASAAEAKAQAGESAKTSAAAQAAAEASQANLEVAEKMAVEAAGQAGEAAGQAGKAAQLAASAEAKAGEAAQSAATAGEKAGQAAQSAEESKRILATTPIEFKWATVTVPGKPPYVKGSWRRTGEQDWHDIGTISSGADGNSVTSATVNPDGHLILSMSRGGEIDAGLAKGPRGVSVTGASINDQYHLILELDNGTRVDAGNARGAEGKNAPRIVSGRVDQATGTLTLALDDGQEITAAGSLTGPAGPAPVIEAGEMSATPDGSYSIRVAQTGDGKYAVNLRMPPPSNISQDLVKSMIAKAIADVELLALAGL
ncbi:hypothetical protein [Mobiluncus mulieris]|uniref:hypothetical protein n=1 Tax=Mobiluncus mulieris TaxID=2052 RepID=UPI000DF8CA66|nr:hypothetical protein [Mobiluncus mulieris]STY84706.1 Transcription initiation factor TFIID, subunit TAF12 (also component of histone acetyltransferase SAGA) [Mobiluncus mulieris]